MALLTFSENPFVKLICSDLHIRAPPPQGPYAQGAVSIGDSAGPLSLWANHLAIEVAKASGAIWFKLKTT
jgi:hypothetical protein